MKNPKIKQNIILFVIIPLVTIIIALICCVYINHYLWKPQVNLDALSENYGCGNLNEEIRLTNITDTDLNIENKDIIVYSIYEIVYNHEGYENENYVIAFYGDDVEIIDELIEDIKYVGSGTVSYWDGEYEILNLGKYIDEYELNSENISIDSEVRLYSIDNYKGYKIEYNNGLAMGSAFIFIVIGILLIIILAIELIIAIIIKITLNKQGKN